MPKLRSEQRPERIALVDCNNMFASCEMAFRPELKGKPIVVLSSNDACCIARNYEAKALGIGMAQPYYEVRHLEQTKGLIAFSANFTLYTNMSQRIVSIIEQYSPDVVPYSIDESFFIVPENYSSLIEAGTELRQAILRQTGIGTGVGISTSKTLAKLANGAAKKFPKTGGVVDLASDPLRREKLLAVMDIDEVWGVGKAIAKKLRDMGVNTALDLAKFGAAAAKSEFSVVLARTVTELNGEAVLPWEADTAINQQIIASRSLGSKVTDRETVFASIAHHVGRGVNKLREQNAVATTITVSIRTNAFSSVDPQYSNSATCQSTSAHADIATFTGLAAAALDSIWREGYGYVKTGIVITNITEKGAIQEDLFAADTSEHDDKRDSLHDTLDAINRKYGRGTTVIASQRQGGEWNPRAEFRSPEYTTKWPDIPLVKA